MNTHLGLSDLPSLVENNSLIPDNSNTLGKSKYSFKCNIKPSKDLPNLFFTNKISRVNIVECNSIKEIYELLPKVIDLDSLPFIMDEELFSGKEYTENRGKRYKKIFAAFGISYDESTLMKGKMKDKSCSLRIYISIDYKTNEACIVLFDPHHLLATAPSKYKKEYSKYKQCMLDITSLFKDH